MSGIVRKEPQVFSSFFLLGMVAVPPFPDALEDASIRVLSTRDLLENSLLVGNGDIHGLLWTDAGTPTLILTKNDVWDARLDTSQDPPLPTLARLKDLAKAGVAITDPILPEGTLWTGPDSYHAHPYPCPRACARIRVGQADQDPWKEEIAGSLDLSKGLARLCETEEGFPGLTIRALDEKNVFLLKTQAPVSLQAMVSEDLPASNSGVSDQGTAWIVQEIPGDLDWPGMSFACALATKGVWSAVSIVTSRESEDPRSTATDLVESVLLENPEALILRHEKAWFSFWSRSALRLDDPVLQRAWYQSLYFLRCVSKPGVICPGLFASLVDDKPAWHGDYHTNYNIQQTFWGCYPANHPELSEPYDRLISEYLPRARWLAREIFDMQGAYYPHVLFAYEPLHPENCLNPIGRQYIHHTWGMTLGVAGFSVQPLWWHYKYDPDEEFLRRTVYPAIREVALFYAEFVEQCEERDGHAVLSPTVSPEHWGWTPGFHRNRNCAFDIALFQNILEAAIEAANILQVEAPLVKRFEAAKAKLPGYPLFTRDDAREPVVVDVEDAPPITYNITVPTTPVFPGDVIHWGSTEEEKRLFLRTIRGIEWNGNNSMVLLAVARARLGEKDTRSWLGEEVRARLRSNGTLTLNRKEPHHRFNDFGHYTEQFGVGMAVSELLLQSVGDLLRLFPALDEACDASFQTLRAQGGFLVSAKRAKGKVVHLAVESTAGGELRLESPWPTLSLSRNDSDWEKADMNEEGRALISTRPGDRFIFRP